MRIRWIWIALTGLLYCSAVLGQAPQAVSTFESIGLSWVPAGAAANNECSVRCRVQGATVWRDGWPLFYDDGDAEYRGSLVHLVPATTYEIELTLAVGRTTQTLKATTSAQQVSDTHVP